MPTAPRPAISWCGDPIAHRQGVDRDGVRHGRDPVVERCAQPAARRRGSAYRPGEDGADQRADRHRRAVAEQVGGRRGVDQQPDDPQQLGAKAGEQGYADEGGRPFLDPQQRQGGAARHAGQGDGDADVDRQRFARDERRRPDRRREQGQPDPDGGEQDGADDQLSRRRLAVFGCLEVGPRQRRGDAQRRDRGDEQLDRQGQGDGPVLGGAEQAGDDRDRQRRTGELQDAAERVDGALAEQVPALSGAARCGAHSVSRWGAPAQIGSS